VIERFLNHGAVHYYHPAGSCKIGPTDRSRRGRRLRGRSARGL
jgi:hypothetical protein